MYLLVCLCLTSHSPQKALLAHDAAGKKLSDFDPASGSKVYRDMGAVETAKEAECDSIMEVTWTNLENGQPAIGHVEAGLGSGKNVITTNKGPVVHA